MSLVAQIAAAQQHVNVIWPLFMSDMAVDRPHAVGSAVGLRLMNHGVVPIATGDGRE